MARKRKTNPLDNLVDLVSLLPWWAGVVIAAAAYVVLHRMAAPVHAVAVQPGQVGNLIGHTVISVFATVGQYVVPVLALIGAAISFFRRKQRTALLTDVAQAQCADALNGMSWREFEKLVGEAYRLQGYRVSETGGGGADGGIDLVLTKNNEKFLAQCKQWKAFKVGVDVVRELYGVMAAMGATGGFVVTSGRFTEDARAFAEGRNVRLVDGPSLFLMIRQAKQSLTPIAQSSSNKPQELVPKEESQPSCPVCNSGMIKRIARKGSKAGGEFWGCSKFPTCRGVRQLG